MVNGLALTLLLVFAVAIPVAGFVLMLGYAKKGATYREQRWRKTHGMLFWVLLPTFSGLLTIAGMLLFSSKGVEAVGMGLLALSTTFSFLLQRRHKEV